MSKGNAITRRNFVKTAAAIAASGPYIITSCARGPAVCSYQNTTPYPTPPILAQGGLLHYTPFSKIAPNKVNILRHHTCAKKTPPNYLLWEMG